MKSLTVCEKMIHGNDSAIRCHCRKGVIPLILKNMENSSSKEDHSKIYATP